MDVRKKKPDHKLTRQPDTFFSQEIDWDAIKHPSGFDIEAELLQHREKKAGRPWRILGYFCMTLFLAGTLYAGFFTYKLHLTQQKIAPNAANPESFAHGTKEIIASIVSPERKKLRGEEAGRINILLMGMAGEGRAGKFLTDTIMVMSIDPRNRKVGLLSIPRDLYANIPDTRLWAKINSVYQYGLRDGSDTEPIKATISDITGLEINYYLVVDYSGFEEIIDDLGGINVMVERDFKDTRFPGPNYSYETFEINTGFHQLDGTTALKYVRLRHGDPEGDFGRAKRQQQVIQAVKNKAFSLGTFLNVFRLNALLDSLGESVRTDIPIDEAESFIALAREVDTQNINNVVVDAWKKDSLLKVSHVLFGSVWAFVLVPRAGNYSEIQELAANIFDLDRLRRQRAEMATEEASIAILNLSSDRELGYKIKDLLRDRLGFKDITLLKATRGSEAAETVAYDRTKGQKIFSLNEIVTKIPAHLLEKGDTIDSEADLVLVLGKDIVEQYAYEEKTMDDLNNTELDQQYLELIKEK